MNEPDRAEAMRQVAREALRELLPDLLEGRARGVDTANGSDPDVVPLVPAPPVAAVLRPSTWSGPAVAGEVIGDGMARPRVVPAPPPVAPAPPAGATAHPTPRSSAGGAGSGSPGAAPQLLDASVETVRLDSDEDLNAFVRALVARLENPRDRLAIRAGRLRFAMHRSSTGGGAGAGAGSVDGEVVRVAKGAVTERTVRDAAARGARLVLAHQAVLTPLARDQARTLGVTIEREARC